MTTGSGAILTGDDSAAEIDVGSDDTLLGDWEDVRADGDIQFAPVEIPDTTVERPEWLDRILSAIGDFLSAIFKPVGQFLGVSWPVLQWILLGLAVLVVLYIIYRVAEPYWISRAPKSEDAEPEWTPNRDEALALLEDADRLAAEGRFDAATHLLLQRSVGQISAVRPDWVDPSSTAREIAAIPALPEAARKTFRTIAERVERSLFALQQLGAEDWRAARAAYAEFALQRLNGGNPR